MKINNLKIKNFFIHSFRGIPNELNIDFTDKEGKAISAIISGDNGSGKSSIVEALEYNLQGRINRSLIHVLPDRTYPISLVHVPAIAANTKTVFNNGKIFERGIDVINSQKYGLEVKCTDQILLTEFSIVPVVLRRSDIISFGYMPREERQVLFFSFFYDNHRTLNDVEKNAIHWKNSPYIISLKDKYVDLKKRRREEVNKLAKLLATDSSNIPYGEKNVFLDYISKIINKYNNRGGSQTKLSTIQNKFGEIISEVSENIVKLTDEIHDINVESETLLNSDIFRTKIAERKIQNEEFIKKSAKLLKESFLEITNIKCIKNVELILGSRTSASLDISITLDNGRKTTPNQFCSEANYDLLVLLLYISLIRASSELGQSKVLILDDVVQSVDSTVRGKFFDYIVQKCKDWQFIVTCHDDLWKNQMRTIFNRNGHSFKEFSLLNWDYYKGPVLYEVTDTGYDSSLQKAILTGNKQIIASIAGITLEKICQKLSFSLAVSIHRKYEDKYTLNDLWQPVRSSLKNTKLYNLLNEIDRDNIVRNMYGSHANEWAESLSLTEILSFANNVVSLYELVYCKKCFSWISKPESSTKSHVVAECKCRHLNYKDKKGEKEEQQG